MMTVKQSSRQACRSAVLRWPRPRRHYVITTCCYSWPAPHDCYDLLTTCSWCEYWYFLQTILLSPILQRGRYHSAAVADLWSRVAATPYSCLPLLTYYSSTRYHWWPVSLTASRMQWRTIAYSSSPHFVILPFGHSTAFAFTAAPVCPIPAIPQPYRVWREWCCLRTIEGMSSSMHCHWPWLNCCRLYDVVPWLLWRYDNTWSNSTVPASSRWRFIYGRWSRRDLQFLLLRWYSISRRIPFSLTLLAVCDCQWYDVSWRGVFDMTWWWKVACLLSVLIIFIDAVTADRYWRPDPNYSVHREVWLLEPSETSW